MAFWFVLSTDMEEAGGDRDALASRWGTFMSSIFVYSLFSVLQFGVRCVVSQITLLPTYTPPFCLSQVSCRWSLWWYSRTTAIALWQFTTSVGRTTANPCWLSWALGFTPCSGQCPLYWAGAAMALRGQGRAALYPGRLRRSSHTPTSSVCSPSAWVYLSWWWSTAMVGCSGQSNR